MKGIHALHFLKLPSMAIFPWGFDHFISEIADEKQHPENPPSLRPNPSARGDASLWDMGLLLFHHYLTNM